MTPAIELAKKLNLHFHLHEYQHDPDNPHYGLEAVEKMGVDGQLVFKTLVVQDEHSKKLAVAVIPVMKLLNLKKFAKAMAWKKAQMADPKLVERTTGYILGGVSPLGQKKVLPTLIDISANELPEIYCSAGRRGLEIQISPHDLAHALNAKFVELVQESDHSFTNQLKGTP